MYEVKMFEVRDRATLISVVALKLTNSGGDEKERYLISRAGYGPVGSVLLSRLDGCGKAVYDPYYWRDRTLQTSHQFILLNWDELNTGDVIDVEFILHESDEPKKSERYGSY